MSAVFCSSSYRALAMLASSSLGFWREGLLAAILLSSGADILGGGCRGLGRWELVEGSHGRSVQLFSGESEKLRWTDLALHAKMGLANPGIWCLCCYFRVSFWWIM